MLESIPEYSISLFCLHKLLLVAVGQVSYSRRIHGYEIFDIPFVNVRDFQQKIFFKYMFYKWHSSVSGNSLRSLFSPVNLKNIYCSHFHLLKIYAKFHTLIANWLWKISSPLIGTPINSNWTKHQRSKVDLEIHRQMKVSCYFENWFFHFWPLPKNAKFIATIFDTAWSLQGSLLKYFPRYSTSIFRPVRVK